MPQQFVPGAKNYIRFVYPGQPDYLTIHVSGTSWDEELTGTFNITNSGSAGVMARIAEKLDGKGTVQAYYDLLASPYLIGQPSAVGIITGNLGRLEFYVANYSSATNIFKIPVMITRVHYESQIMGVVQYGFDVEMNSQVGFYQRPTA